MQNEKSLGPYVGLFLCLWAYDMCIPLSIITPLARHVLPYLLIILAIVCYVKIPKSNIYKKDIVFQIFIFWTFFIIARGSLISRFPLSGGDMISYGFESSTMAIFFIALSRFSLFCFLLPLVYGFSYTRSRLASLIFYIPRIALVTAIISALLYFFYREAVLTASYGDTILESASGETVILRTLIFRIFPSVILICLTSYFFPYLKDKWYYWIIPIALFGYFLINIKGGGRGDTIVSFLYCIFFIFFLYKERVSKGSTFSKKFIAIVVVIVFLYGIYYLFVNTNLFLFLIVRTFEQGDVSGSFVENNRDIWMDGMVSYFNSHPLYWIFGKGINGYYVMPNGAMRQWMEYGFMWLIMKGGVVYLVLFCTLLLRSAYRGLFRSNNLFCKACGIVCLLRVMELIPYGMPDVSSSSLLVWMCCGLLYGNDIRSLSDSDISTMIRRPKNYLRKV